MIKHSPDHIYERIVRAEKDFLLANTTFKARSCLYRANNWRKKGEIPAKKYKALEKGWKIEYGRPDDLMINEPDPMFERESLVEAAQGSPIIKKVREPVHTLKKTDLEKTTAFIKISDYLAQNPETLDQKNYKKFLENKLEIPRKFIDLFFSDSVVLAGDSIASVLSFDSMTNSEIYTSLRQNDVKSLEIIQTEVRTALRTRKYNGKPVTLPQLMELSKILGARIRQFDPLAKGKNKANRLPAKAVIILAQFVNNNPAKK